MPGQRNWGRAKKGNNIHEEKIHGIQQIQAAEAISLVGTPEHIRMVLNKYVDLGLTHFVLDLVGLDESTIKLIDSKIIKKYEPGDLIV